MADLWGTEAPHAVMPTVLLLNKCMLVSLCAKKLGHLDTRTDELKEAYIIIGPIGLVHVLLLYKHALL